ncbi:LysR family transcriptional regulator [Pseudoalteromonas sp. B137]
MDRVTAAQVFIDIAHSGSFTATAERLAMSRPMVTRYLEAMENWVGVRLLHRTTRKISLTSHGEQCLKDIELWLDTAQQLVSNIQSVDGLSGSIKIATSMSFGHAQLMPALKEFMLLHPNLSINVDLQDSTTDLIKSRIDLAIRIASNPDDSLISKPIAVCRSVIVADKNYLADTPAINSPEDLKLHQCLSYTNFERQVWHLSRGAEHQSIQVSSRLSANEATSLLQATLSGAGLSMQPTYMANKLIKSGELTAVLPGWQPIEMNIYALYSSRKFQPPAVRALIDFLEAYFKSNMWD